MLRYDLYLTLALLVIIPYVLSRVARYNDEYRYNFRGEDKTYDAEFRSNTMREEQAEMSNLPRSGELFEEDIQMDDRLRANVLGVNKKTALNYGDTKWVNGEIVYKVDDNFESCARRYLEKAIEEFEKRTCITFREATENDVNYVYYTSEKNQCSSNIGRVGGMQKIFIGRDCCVLGTVLHETMHALGFIHEHSRHDRDQYVQVKWPNINKDERSNFNKYDVESTTDNEVPYNLASVMHYRNDAFTNNGEDTLLVNGEPNLKFGQRIKFSTGDVDGINNFYNCPPKERIYEGLYLTYSGRLAEQRKKDMELIES